jgi:hypothetical protein
MPMWALLFLISILTFFSIIMSVNDAVEIAKHAAESRAGGQQPPVVGALAEP